jgi:hypothetical protein
MSGTESSQVGENQRSLCHNHLESATQSCHSASKWKRKWNGRVECQLSSSQEIRNPQTDHPWTAPWTHLCAVASSVRRPGDPDHRCIALHSFAPGIPPSAPCAHTHHIPACHITASESQVLRRLPLPTARNEPARSTSHRSSTRSLNPILFLPSARRRRLFFRDRRQTRAPPRLGLLHPERCDRVPSTKIRSPPGGRGKHAVGVGQFQHCDRAGRCKSLLPPSLRAAAFLSSWVRDTHHHTDWEFGAGDSAPWSNGVVGVSPGMRLSGRWAKIATVYAFSGFACRC